MAFPMARILNSLPTASCVRTLLAARSAPPLGVGLLSGGYGREELERASAYRLYQDRRGLFVISTRWACAAKLSHAAASRPKGV